ncbi:MAG: LysE family translocator [Burkholderiaceae bacterium]
MAFVLGSALTGGRAKGLAAVAGIVAGGVCHVVMTALGISVLLKLVPGAFNALLLAGALYIAWIGFSLMRSESAFGVEPVARIRPWRATFRQGALTSLLNPKAICSCSPSFRNSCGPNTARCGYRSRRCGSSSRSRNWACMAGWR